ncbi:MAG: HD domain-containing protein [Gammaproteobacteria bacterium]|nr:HD domain-containing protein [Gammaproteobacteria bacterium]
MSKVTTADKLDTVGAEALAAFFERFSVAHLKIEQSLLLLELDPDDAILIDDLVDAVSAIKSALEAIGFNEISVLIDSLISLLHAIKRRHLTFQTVISDIVLLLVDDVKTVFEKMLEGDQRCVLLDRLPQLCKSIELIERSEPGELDEACKDALLMLDPSTEMLEPVPASELSLKTLFDDNEPDDMELAAYGVADNEDFIFFRGLASPLESRANYWQGRSARMLRLALKMNESAGRPVDPDQLTVAVYMHDAGMALLPLEVINKNGVLCSEEIKQIEQHPKIGYELLRYMKQWGAAAEIVLQHHERVDGKGYPYGLKDDEICDGAKILAIVDMIDARLHERVHATLLKRPLLRAAIEVGKNADRQFSGYWVDVFKKIFIEMRNQQNEVNKN